MKPSRTVLLAWLIAAASISGHGQTTNGVDTTLAQNVANQLRASYGAPPSLDTNILDLSSTNYSTLETYVGTGTNASYGTSQQLVVQSLFAFGASMDNATWQSISSIFTGGVPLTNTAVIDSAQGNASVGLISGWVIVPTLVDVFATMDIYIQDFFGGIVYFILFTALIITMGIAILKQMHEGKLDVASWLLKSVASVVIMINANQFCNYVLATAIGIAALINGSVIHGLVYQNGMAAWYMKLYGPELLQGVYSFISSGKEPDISRAFTTGYDTENVQAYIFTENGSGAAATLCEYMGSPDAYNGDGGGNAGLDQTGGVPIKELEGMYCLMVLYNVGYQNLAAHATLGDSNAPTYQTNFQAACARVFFGDPSITVSNTDKISQTVSALQVSGTSQWQYLTQKAANDKSAQQVENAYQEPGTLSLQNVVSAVQAHSSNTSIWSVIKSYVAKVVNLGKSVINWANGIVAGIMNLIVSGILQVILMAGMFFWMIIAMALCKMGVVLVVLTSPLLVLDGSSKIFWNAVKTMVYPSIYPAALIVLMQLTAAMSSWIGTIAANVTGFAMIFSVIPLFMGIVLVFMLPKIVKVMLTGGNAVLAQLGGVKTAVMVGVAAATGGAALAALGTKAAAGAAAAGSAAGGGGAGGGVGGGAAGAGAAGGGCGGGGGGGGRGGTFSDSTPTTPIGKAMAGVGKMVGAAGNVFGRGVGGAASAIGTMTNARIPGTSGTAGKAAVAAAFGGVPGIALYAISARRNALQQRQAAEQERARQAAEKARQDATVIRIPDEEMQRAQSS